MKPHIKLRTKSITTVTPGSIAPGQMAPAVSSSFWGLLREPFSGAWQKNVQPETTQNLLAFSAIYSCVSLISGDISKLRIKLTEELDDGIWVELERNSPFLPVLRKPNRYQTRQQFIQQWVASKYLHGNTFVLKDRDARGIVTAMYVLNPFYVQPLVASDGSVFYRISREWLAGVQQDITVPASEIIHDRCCVLWHPLVGVSPIYACGASATQGIRIQSNSESFFKNMSRPGGHLTAAETIDDRTALRLKEEFERNFSNGGLGRLLVTGGGLKYEPMAVPAQEAQLVEQLKWTVEDVARAYGVPMYKLSSATMPPSGSVTQLNQDYYSQTLQVPMEAIEALLDEGLELPSNLGVELDLDGLLRMDPLSRAETAKTLVGAAIKTPNEIRLTENLPKMKGGDALYLQQQYYSLEALAKRDQANPAPSSTKPPDASTAPGQPPSSQGEDGMDTNTGALPAALAEAVKREFESFELRVSSVEQAMSELANGFRDGMRSVTEAFREVRTASSKADDDKTIDLDADAFHRELEIQLLGTE